MDFDEYDYLEKTVENPIPSKEDSTTINGVNSDLKEKRKTSSRTRSDDVDLDAERPSKRDRHEVRDRHRERGSSRHHSNAERDGEKERRSRREERDGRDKDRHRDKYRDMEKERTRDRDGDSEMEREYEHERERSRRSRSRSERHREEERDKIKEMDRELDRERERSRRSHSRSERYRDEERDRYREKSRERNRERDGRHYKEKKEEAAEPEADPERDQRTVFAYQINLKADERDVYEFFSRAGKVRDVRLIMDRNSRRSKGVGYIEFYDAMSVPMAIALTGQKLLGQAVMVKPSEAEKNLVQSTSTVSGGTGVFGAQSAGGRKLYVGNLHFNINEEQLRAVFESFGTVELVQLPLDSETGHCKGFAFIQFARLEDAKVAQTINGQLEIAGRTIKVSAVTDQVVGQDTGASGGDLDDDEGGGLALNACDRALLMQKLDRSGTATSVANTIMQPAPNPVLPLPTASVLGIPPIVNHLAQPPFPALAGLPAGLSVGGAAAVDGVGIPSECLLLKNMFDPSIETEPDFDLDIKEDVEDECSKYGAVKHIFVDKNSAGFVYLRFDNITSSSNAQRSLHGRWFAGKMITATFMVPRDYAVKFPNSS